MSIRKGLVEELNSELEELGKMEVGSDTYKIAVDGVTKLADRIIEIDKFEADNATKFEAQNMESELKAIQIKNEKRDQMFKNGIAIGTTVLSIAAYGLAFIASVNFEREGNLFSTEAGKSSMKNLLKLRF